MLMPSVPYFGTGAFNVYGEVITTVAPGGSVVTLTPNFSGGTAVVAMHAGLATGKSLTSITVGGLSPTLRVTADFLSNQPIRMYEVTSLSSGFQDVVMTFTATPFRCGVATFNIPSGYTYKSSTVDTSGSDPNDVSINTAAGDLAVFLEWLKIMFMLLAIAHW